MKTIWDGTMNRILITKIKITLDIAACMCTQSLRLESMNVSGKKKFLVLWSLLDVSEKVLIFAHVKKRPLAWAYDNLYMHVYCSL